MKKIKIVLLALVICFSLCIPAFALDKHSHAVYDEDASPDSYHIVDDDSEWYDEARDFMIDELLMGRMYTDHYFNGSSYYFGGTYLTFAGERNISRSEVAVIFNRYNGSYDTLSESIYKDAVCEAFVDVPDGQWFTPAAKWAHEIGIVNGVGGAYFAPERTITREEFAAMLYRYTNYLEEDTSARADFSAFADGGSVSSWATDAMSWAVAEGLISGKPDNLLAPQDTITRAEVAVIIYRFNNEVKAHRDIWDGN